MRTVSSLLFSSFVMVVNAGASEFPIPVYPDVFVEEAWATSNGQGGLEIFLVINNRSLAPVGALKVDVPGASGTVLRAGSGTEIAPVIPPHAELYMQPGGVHVLAETVQAGASVPVSVSVDGSAPVMFNATVLSPGEIMPDHHDYDHG